MPDPRLPGPARKPAARPIAIVGVGFRLPGDLRDADALWQALLSGRDLVSAVGPERWAVESLVHPRRSEPGRSITFSAGTLPRVDGFDAAFFGISPREAVLLDPQQRLLLELAWEAMEDAGVRPSSLAGTDCAVYAGISGLDYGIRALDDLASMGAHSMTGNTLSVAANRLSYVFDLHGPSMAVDTACSSSLVALSQACQAIAAGQASAALVGGVNLLLHPYPFVGFTKASMLSAEGRCRPFAQGGDGYVRAEGGVVLLLKPLEQAEADGDRIHAVIRGVGANADGARKSGLTIPSVEGQVELLRQVLDRAGLSPDQVDYLEAHGTGTRVGDPVEAQAIGRVFGQRRAAGDPLPIGSVKGNLGHLEPASGVAGLVKALQVLRHRSIPPSIHADALNADIDFDGLNLRVVRQATPLPRMRRPLRVGVNSFGFGGANAHVLLEEYPQRRRRGARSAPAHPAPLVISAASPAALRDLALRYATLLAGDADRHDVAHAAWHRRDWLAERIALTDVASESAVAALEAFGRGESPPALLRETALAGRGAVAFIYSGNGCQWVGMGRALLAASATFQQAVGQVDDLLREAGAVSVQAALASDDPATFDDTAVAQPALFAIQVGLTRMLRDAGLEPAAVAGHSVGEIAAAWACGALDLPAAVRVVVARSRAQASTRGAGRMEAVGLGADAAQALIDAAGLAGVVEIAAHNSPGAVTLSGPVHGLDAFSARLETQGVFHRRLDLDYAFHSAAMDPVSAELAQALHGLAPGPARTTFVSTVTGAGLEGPALDAGYWWRNVREPVLFDQAVRHLAAGGCRVFVEIGPHAILQRYVADALGAAAVPGKSLGPLRRGDDGPERVREAVIRAALLGAPVDATRQFPASPATLPELPVYPWQHERFWLEPSPEGYGLIHRHPVHPLLGHRLKEHEAAWEVDLDPVAFPWLADHKVGGAVVMPAAAYVEMALAAAAQHYGADSTAVEDLDIVAPVVFDAEHARTLRVVLSAGEHRFRIEGRQRMSGESWVLHAVGRLPGADAPGQATVPSIEAPGPAAIRVEAEAHHALAGHLGLDYGPAFRGLGAIRVDGGRLEAGLGWSPSHEPATSPWLLHPAVLDQCFQAVMAFFREELGAPGAPAFLPVRVGRLVRFSGQATRLRASLVRRSPRSVLVDFELLDDHGQVVARVSGVRFRAAPIHAREKAPALWEVTTRLRPHPLAEGVPVFPESQRVLDLLRRHLGTAGASERQRYFDEVAPLVEMLPVAFCRDALLAVMGQDAAEPIPDERLDAWRERHPLLRWLLARLGDEGILQPCAGGARVTAADDIPSAVDIWRAVLGDCPAAMPELLLAGRVGMRIPDLLRDEPGRLHVPRSASHAGLLDQLLDQAPTYSAINAVVALAVEVLLRQWPATRRLRVLEISGGGALTGTLLPLLPPGQSDLVLADTDPQRLARHESEHGDSDVVTLARLDADTLELSAERALPESFDLVILHHWIHGLAQPGRALSALGRRLAPGGMLLLAERHPDGAANLMFGDDTHWWHPAGDGSLESSLHTPAEWQRLMGELGWKDSVLIEEPAARGLGVGSYLLLATVDEVRPERQEPAVSSWRLLCDDPSAVSEADTLRRRLESLGQRVEVCGPSVTDQAFAGAPVQNLLVLQGPAPLAMRAEDLARRCDRLRARLVSAAGLDAPPRVWLVTRGGLLASSVRGDAPPQPAAAALWGLGRVAMNELPAIGLTLLDLQGSLDDPSVAAALELELLFPDGEREVLLARDGRRVPVMEPARPGARPQGRAVTSRQVPPEGHRLDFSLPGQLRNLEWRPAARPIQLEPDQVEIQACAAGLNFRDVMYAMGLLSDEAVENGFAGASLGLEVSGRVVRCGPAVTRFAPGDEVLAFAGASFASHVVVPERAVARKPATWRFSDAATIPTVFFTVWYALKHLANLQPGERVLVHGAAGGVGIAAIQVARYLGAEIIATAGSPSKRDFATLLGAHHTFDSRSLRFVDGVLEATGGEGVDVVLNSLAGEAIRRNFQVLRPFGRFLELGKRDFYENTHVGLRPFKDNISYHGIDADQLMKARPDLAARVFREVMALFESGVLRPLPHRVYPADRIVDAFRHMQQSRQVGKVVIDLETPPRRLAASEARGRLQLRREGTYLVTGGLGGFGLESARWLATRGAGHLLLMGRRGADTPGFEAARAELEALGARVHACACDVTDRRALGVALDQARRQLPPLRGVLHAAMVLDDGLMANLDETRLGAVLAPKLMGAWHLHELTQGQPLDHFILYSSATTFIGNPGQASYVAANAGLEALARLRREAGLPGLAVAWGPIADAGILARQDGVRAGLEARFGAAAISAAAALATLESVVLEDRDGLAVLNLDWGPLARLLPSSGHARFDWLRRHHGRGLGSDADADIRARIAGKSRDEVQTILREGLVAEVAEILRMPPGQLDPQRSLYDLGMDSLMAVELAVAVQKRFDVHLPPMVISESPTVARIAERLTGYLLGEEAAPSDSTQALVSSLASQHGARDDTLPLAEVAEDVRIKVASGTRLIS